MSEESWDSPESKSSAIKSEENPRLGFGRGRIPNNAGPEPNQQNKWNSNSSGFTSGFNRDNNNTNRGFKSHDDSNGFQKSSEGRSNDRRGDSSAAFKSGNEGNSRACYNCNQSGHFSRECPEPKRERGGQNSGPNRNFPSNFNSNQGTGFQSSSFQSSDNSWRGNNNRSDDNQDRGEKRFNNEWRPSNQSSNSTGNNLFQERRNFSSDDRGQRSNDREQNNSGFRSGGGGQAHGPREFFRSGTGNHQKSENTSDDIFDKDNHSSGIKRVEHYVPPTAPKTETEIFGAATQKGQNFSKYQHSKVKCTPEGLIEPIEMYEEAELHPNVLANIRRANFEEPTSIQCYTIRAIQGQHDLMACAQTGSGKTAAFLLPIISNLLTVDRNLLNETDEVPSPVCLILSPTRELALQTEREARKFSFETPIKCASAIGGHDVSTSCGRLQDGCHILSATTGRLMDIVKRGRVSLKKVRYLVLDEADRMLDEGFEQDIRRIQLLGLPQKESRITSMFSATFPGTVQRLATTYLRKDYIFLVVGTVGGANEDISQTIEEVRQNEKKDRLVQLLDANLKDQRCLIFVEQKRSADYLGALLSQKQLMSTTMHGDRTQQQREEAVRQFTNGKCPILVATSVAARGLDFPLIGYVVNYDLPDTSDFYIHRIGRTGRAGHLGKSISFFDPDRSSDRVLAPDLVLKLEEAGQPVPEFLKKFTGDKGNYSSSSGSRTSDLRFRSNDRPTGGRELSMTGGSSAAGRATTENWD